MNSASHVTTSECRARVCSLHNIAGHVPVGLVVAGLFLLGLLVRLGDFDAMVNPDMYHLWSERTVRFMNALAAGNYAETYQSHHPGVTLMWLMGSTWQAFGVLQLPIGLHPEKVRLAVWPIVLVGSLFGAVTYPLLLRLLGRKRWFAALLTGLLLATEPLLVAHSRNSHLDILAITFAWVAALLALVAKRENSYGFAVGSGICMGFALLSKISTAGFALGVAAVFLVDALQFRRLAPCRVKQLTVIAVTSVVTVFAVLPALWVAPVQTFNRFHHGLLHEVDKAVAFMLFDTSGIMVVPSWVYGLFVVFLVTPELWIPGVFGSWFLTKAKVGLRRFLLDQGIIIAPVLYFLFSSNNVGVRNTILVLPLFATITALVIAELHTRASVLWPKLVRVVPLAILVLVFGGRTWRLLDLYPLPITYCSRWTGVECSSVFHVGWGEGMKEAALFIRDYTSKHYPPDKPPRIFGSGYASIVRVWTAANSVRLIDDAHLLIDYVSDWQRHGKRATAIANYVLTRNIKPLYEVHLDSRSYVRIYPGPRAIP